MLPGKRGKFTYEYRENNVASLRVLEKCGFIPNGQIGEEEPRFVCVFS